MLPLAKAAVLAVLLGGGTVGAYALTGGFGSGSGNGNETTAQEGTSESNAVSPKPAATDTPQDAPRGSEINGAVGARAPEETGADATQQLSSQSQKPQRDSGNPGSNESDPNPAESEGDRDATNQNTISGGDQNIPGKDAAIDGETTKAKSGGEEAEVALREEKTVSPDERNDNEHSVGA